MIKSVRSAAAAALAAPLLAAVIAAPANAAPEDVTATAEVQGSDVEFIITNNSGDTDGGITGDGWHLLPDWVKLVFAAINAGSGVLGSS
ncbi:hypothetical protein [Rhodococcus xishaensis]|uniref:hypothetical protein n=1 Tax=Rhodococcus xishaensis TaxID=2487364 RepID=UPI000FDD4D9B|nr:hypothetical protein [Rhodococcus xishaensis]